MVPIDLFDINYVSLLEIFLEVKKNYYFGDYFVICGAFRSAKVHFLVISSR